MNEFTADPVALARRMLAECKLSGAYVDICQRVVDNAECACDTPEGEQWEEDAVDVVLFAMHNLT